MKTPLARRLPNTIDLTLNFGNFCSTSRHVNARRAGLSRTTPAATWQRSIRRLLRRRWCDCSGWRSSPSPGAAKLAKRRSHVSLCFLATAGAGQRSEANVRFSGPECVREHFSLSVRSAVWAEVRLAAHTAGTRGRAAGRTARHEWRGALPTSPPPSLVIQLLIFVCFPLWLLINA